MDTFIKDNKYNIAMVAGATLFGCGLFGAISEKKKSETKDGTPMQPYAPQPGFNIYDDEPLPVDDEIGNNEAVR